MADNNHNTHRPLKVQLVLVEALVPFATRDEVARWAERYGGALVSFRPPDGVRVFPAIVVRFPNIWRATDATRLGLYAGDGQARLDALRHTRRSGIKLMTEARPSTTVHGDNRDCPQVVTGEWAHCHGHQSPTEAP